jgi:hypothetical protein
MVGLRRLVDTMWSQLGGDATSRNELRGLIAGMVTDWVAKDAEAGRGRMLVVFVDDLDRCDDAVIVEICEAIKLYLDVPGLVFVLACDLAVISRGVANKARGESDAGRAYLEKIVQVAHRLPPPNESQIMRLVEGYAEQSGTSALLDSSARKILAQRSGNNPRRIKRIINSLVLEHRLNPEWTTPPLSGALLVTAILLQHLYPSFYERLISDDAGVDPIQDFLDYAAVKAQATDPPVAGSAWWSRANRLFTARGMTVPERGPSAADQLAAQLETVDRDMPSESPALARNPAFLALLRATGGPDQRAALRSQLIRRPLGRDPLAEPTERAATAPVRDGGAAA